MENLRIEGINIAYTRHGKGPPLILIHGYPLDHTIWEGVKPYLDENFDLIIPDLRGFGMSETKALRSSIRDYSLDLKVLLDHLKLKKAYFAGHSMGGYVALAFAEEYPEQVAGMALVSSQTLADTPERQENRLMTAKQVMSDGVGIVVESMTPKLSTDEQVREFVRQLISRQTSLGIFNALNAMAGRSDSSELFSTFEFPVVIIHGDDDALIPVDRGREMKALLPSAHYFELAGQGHMTMMEKPQDVAKALTTLVS